MDGPVLAALSKHKGSPVMFQATPSVEYTYTIRLKLPGPRTLPERGRTMDLTVSGMWHSMGLMARLIVITLFIMSLLPRSS